MSESHEIKVKIEGTEEAAHGVGTFFLFAIPAVLAVALLLGLGFITGLIQFKHNETQYQKQQTMQQRMDGRVGVTQPLKSPVKLIILPRRGCIQIERAYLDGSKITVYIHSRCHVFMDYYQLHVVGRAPDGTIISSDYENTASLPELAPGDKAEWSKDLDQDDRVATIEVWTQDTQ